MTKPEQYAERVEARTHGNRAHARRKLGPMAYVELGEDNGGILLNLSEGGFAVQSALTLTSKEFPQLRFQVPAFQGWLTASGRAVWLSDSKKEAGIQFTELPEQARREIYNWVAAEGEPEKASGRIPSAPRAHHEPSKEIFDRPYRGGGGAHEPAIAQTASASVERPRAATNQNAAVAAAEPPAEDFRFTDYSMFAAAPEKEASWAVPAQRRRSRSGLALLGILVAALFFALGSTMGQGTVERWIANLTGWTTQSQPTLAPKASPPAPPEQKEVGGEVNDKDAKEVPDKEAKSNENANPTPDATGSAQNAVNPEKKASEQQAGKDDARRNSGNTEVDRAADSTVRKAPAGSKTQHFAGSAAPRNDVVSSGVETEHAILVDAPSPGSRPFYINFPGEAISASAAIAVSARRTLEILPNASGRSERVVIGKLISHSDPFYPIEARTRHIEGSVELRARVGRTGQIISVTPISGPGLLTSAAATAVREWRYEPTFINGDPAETLADITVVFRLP